MTGPIEGLVVGGADRTAPAVDLPRYDDTRLVIGVAFPPTGVTVQRSADARAD